jgi:hypothetical protein
MNFNQKTCAGMKKMPDAVFALIFLIAALAVSGGPAPLTKTTGAAPPAGGTGDSSGPVISPDGRYVAFASCAQNLVINARGIPLPALNTRPMNAYLRDRIIGTTLLASPSLDEVSGANSDCIPTGVSADGRYVLFESAAINLVTNTSGAVVLTNQVYLRDIARGVTTLISANSNGVPGNGSCRNSVMTPDGRFIAFASTASNLVANDTNGLQDVFLFDTQSNAMSLISVGAKAPNLYMGSDIPLISADGRYVAFNSTATNLAAGASSYGEIFLRDTVAATNIWVSSYAQIEELAINRAANATSANYAISTNGQYIAYEACPIVNGVPSTSKGAVVLRYNTATGMTDVINTNAAASMSSFEPVTRSLDISADGRFVAFVANVNAQFGETTIQQWDSLSNTVSLASGNTVGSVPTNSLCDYPTMDSTGRYVAFMANISALTSNSPANGINLFVRDMQAGVTSWVDVNAYPPTAPESLNTRPQLSADGSQVAFESLGEGLVANDYNHVYNVFVRNVPQSTTELISAGISAPSTGDGASAITTSCISTNGRYVAFQTLADDFVPANSPVVSSIVMHDMLTSENYLVSYNTNNTQPSDSYCFGAQVSGDGRYVAFSSAALDLVPNQTNFQSDVFVRDLVSNTTTLVSVNTNGTGPGIGPSTCISMSIDGRYVLFQSVAGNLASGEVSNYYGNIYWRDVQAGITKAVTPKSGPSGQPAMGAMDPTGQYVIYSIPSGNGFALYVWNSKIGQNIYTNIRSAPVFPAAMIVSTNGSRIAFNQAGTLTVIDLGARVTNVLGTVKSTSHLTLGFSGDDQYLVNEITPTGFLNQVYLYDFTSQNNTLISQSYTTPFYANSNCDSATLSSDGNYVAWRSSATNLLPGVTNGLPNIYLYSRLTGTISLLTADAYGLSAANDRSLAPTFGAGGNTLAFASWATDLAPGALGEWENIYLFQPYSTTPATNSNGTFPIQNFGFVPTGLPCNLSGGSAPSFTWLAAPGENYVVQYKDDLSAPAWLALTNNVSVVGGEGYAVDLQGTNTQRFYRVVGASAP